MLDLQHITTMPFGRHRLICCFSVWLMACSGQEAVVTDPNKVTKQSACETAFKQLERIQHTLVEVRGPGEPLPEQQEFMGRCLKWPDDIIQCLDLTYQLEHLDDCDKAWSGLPKQDRKTLWKPRKLTTKP